jgi:hypothetical protein
MIIPQSPRCLVKTLSAGEGRLSPLPGQSPFQDNYWRFYPHLLIVLLLQYKSIVGSVAL